MDTILEKQIVALRMQRQWLLNEEDKRADQEEYKSFFRDCSPVQNVFWSIPGEQPYFYFRSRFDDFSLNDNRRSRREIVKGRFQKGGIAYIDYEDWELYGAIYRKTGGLSYKEERLLDFLQKEGPMNIGLIREMTGMLAKEITPILHKLQEKFLVFEDQMDKEWDRAWYVLSDEFPELNFDRYSKTEALQKVLLRYANRIVWFTMDMAKSYYKLSTKDLNTALASLKEKGELVPLENGYITPTDNALLGQQKAVPPSVFFLHRNDFLVKSQEEMLFELFNLSAKEDEKQCLLGFFLIDGFFQGALVGKVKNGPFILDDIIFTMKEPESEKRKKEIIDMLYKIHDPQLSPLKKYNGKKLVPN